MKLPHRCASILTVTTLVAALAPLDLRAQNQRDTLLPPGPPPCVKPTLADDLGLKRCVLAGDYPLADGVIPSGSEVRFGRSARVTSAKLSRPTVMKGQSYPAGSTVFVSWEGRLLSFWLHDNAVIQGHRIRGHEDGIGNAVHWNGRLRAIWLAGEETIDGIPVTSNGNIFRMGVRVVSLGTQRMVWLYDDGRLQQAMLSRDATIAGHKFHKGEVVLLRHDGTPDLTSPKLSTLRWRDR